MAFCGKWRLCGMS